MESAFKGVFFMDVFVYIGLINENGFLSLGLKET